jgi:hypothetical protein
MGKQLFDQLEKLFDGRHSGVTPSLEGINYKAQRVHPSLASISIPQKML